MTRQQKQLAILGVFLVVMIAVYARAFHHSPSLPARHAQGRVAVGQSTPPRSHVAPAMPEPSVQREAQRQRATLLAWGRDPFARGAGAGQISGLNLSGILWDASAPIAIINGQMLRVGEELEGYRVTEITQDRVLLTDGAHTVSLHIAP